MTIKKKDARLNPSPTNPYVVKSKPELGFRTVSNLNTDFAYLSF